MFATARHTEMVINKYNMLQETLCFRSVENSTFIAKICLDCVIPMAVPQTVF